MSTSGLAFQLWEEETSASGWLTVLINTPHQLSADELRPFHALGSVEILFIAPINALIGHTSHSVRSTDMKAWLVLHMHENLFSFTFYKVLKTKQRKNIFNLATKECGGKSLWLHTALHSDHIVYIEVVGVFLCFGLFLIDPKADCIICCTERLWGGWQRGLPGWL